jgi:hypothetical protein
VDVDNGDERRVNSLGGKSFPSSTVLYTRKLNDREFSERRRSLSNE